MRKLINSATIQIIISSTVGCSLVCEDHCFIIAEISTDTLFNGKRGKQ